MNIDLLSPMHVASLLESANGQLYRYRDTLGKELRVRKVMKEDAGFVLCLEEETGRILHIDERKLEQT